ASWPPTACSRCWRARSATTGRASCRRWPTSPRFRWRSSTRGSRARCTARWRWCGWCPIAASSAVWWLTPECAARAAGRLGDRCIVGAMKRPRIPQKMRHRLVSVRDLLATAGPLLVLLLLLLALAYWVLDPTPPRSMVLATGSQRGAYAEFGARYAQLLAKDGIRVELRNTQGAVENLQLLRDPKSGVDVAFVQGGVDGPAQSSEDDNQDLRSLGSLFYEPVWLFYREDSAARLAKSHALTSLSQLAGWRINGGTDGSGARLLLQQLLEV